jgi:hypothetical protein
MSLPQIAIHTGDADIAMMLLEHNIVMERPQPPLDICIGIVRCQKSQHVWLVLRFFDPDDPGYAAYGVPINTPQADIRTVFDMVLSQFNGKPTQFVTLPPLAVN